MARIAALAFAALALAACERFPRDSAGALERIEQRKVVRVGLVENPPWVAGAGGLEPDLLIRWAAEQGARVETRRGDLDLLVEALDKREIDVLLAGLEKKTPYASKLALTQPYVNVRGRDGKKEAHVVAVTPGESALLLSLDRYLKGQDEAALRRRSGMPPP